MVRPRRTEQHTDLAKAIKETAWELIAQAGASSLSLRAIARQLNITAPAIYNYFQRRDDLVTALILDAFHSFGEAQRTAADTVSFEAVTPGSLAARLTAMGMMFRTWAVVNPQRYQLIFGTPIPGYSAPADITVPAAAWALVPMVEALQAGWRAGLLQMPGYPPMSPEVERMFSAWSEFSGIVELEVLYLALAIWTRVHGFVSLEIGSQLPSFLHDPGLVYARELEAFCRQIIKN